MFPIPVEALADQLVLAMLVPETATNSATFVVGRAQWRDPDLLLETPERATALSIQGSRVALRGFDPAILPNIIVPEHLGAVTALATGVTACVSVMVPSPPAVGLTLTAPFYMVSSRGRDQVFLMQFGGEDSDDEEVAPSTDPRAGFAS